MCKINDDELSKKLYPTYEDPNALFNTETLNKLRAEALKNPETRFQREFQQKPVEPEPYGPIPNNNDDRLTLSRAETDRIVSEHLRFAMGGIAPIRNHTFGFGVNCTPNRREIMVRTPVGNTHFLTQDDKNEWHVVSIPVNPPDSLSDSNSNPVIANTQSEMLPGEPLPSLKETIDLISELSDTPLSDVERALMWALSPENPYRPTNINKVNKAPRNLK